MRSLHCRQIITDIKSKDNVISKLFQIIKFIILLIDLGSSIQNIIDEYNIYLELAHTETDIKLCIKRINNIRNLVDIMNKQKKIDTKLCIQKILLQILQIIKITIILIGLITWAFI
jgi:hypothetical protein